jgi:hypothetical protein
MDTLGTPDTSDARAKPTMALGEQRFRKARSVFKASTAGRANPMARTAGRPTYLFKQRGSQNWHVRLQYPDKRVEKSLGTPDRQVAEVLALPMIAEHKGRLLATRPLSANLNWRHEYEPGRIYPGPDGGTIVASDRELSYFDTDGRLRLRGPNAAGWRSPSLRPP